MRVVDALPRTAGGKPKKFLLRERFAGAPEVDDRIGQSLSGRGESQRAP